LPNTDLFETKNMARSSLGCMVTAECYEAGMDLDLVRLRHILAIARARSFSRAAEELNLTQPALSRSVAAIERRYGLRLFDRSRKGAEPTTVGKLIIAEAEKVLRAAQHLNQNMHSYARGKSGDLAIGLGPMIAMLFPRFAKQLFERTPGMSLRVSTRTTEKLVKELLDDEIELILASSSTIGKHPDLDIRVISSLPVAPLVRGEHPLLQGKDLCLADIQLYPLARVAEFGVSGVSQSTTAIVCDNAFFLREIILMGDGIWPTCPRFLRDDVSAGRLVPLILRDFSPADIPLAVIFRKERTLSPMARQMIASFRDFSRSDITVGNDDTA
jgi:DNA-binding transcriptional LysR family regulator